MTSHAAPTIKISEPGRTPLFLVVDRPIELGRDCDGLLLGDRSLSRRHLLVSAVGAGVTVRDLGSTNGTRLDGGGTLTIVFSDIEQSTRRSEQLGDEAWMRLLAFHNALIRRHVERSGGIEVKAQGDGFMLAFPSARSAVLCSIEVGVEGPRGRRAAGHLPAAPASALSGAASTGLAVADRGARS